MATIFPSTTLAEFYAEESAKLRQKFENTGNGREAALERSDLVDAILTRLYDEHLKSEDSPAGRLCLVALGGYGRRELFPQSDIDLLFLSEDESALGARREAIATVARVLWDLRLRVGSTSRPLEQCEVLHRDNLEFSISLLDCRHVAGDAALFARLQNEAIPRLIAREHQDLVGDLVEMTRQRHEKYGETIFHLEPNLKEAPGGLRDFQVTRWLILIDHLKKDGRWLKPEEHWPEGARDERRAAFDFLAAARTFLHFRQERDDNHLTYELQDEAASKGIGGRPGGNLSASDLMRIYFRHARSIDRQCNQLLEDATPARVSVYGFLKDWRSRRSTDNFGVVRGRIHLRRPANSEARAGVRADDPAVAFTKLFELFEFMATTAIPLSREAEHWVEECLPRLNESSATAPGLWPAFRGILKARHSAFALRAMHHAGVLVKLFPEFRAIDSLVVRDFYHRYTVDEHSLMTLQNLNALANAESRAGERSADESSGEWRKRLSEILSELEQPELLYLCLLFHDVGKGTLPGDHVKGSLDAVEGIFERLGLKPAERETIAFLIAAHLEMSATLQRRDIFDPETVRVLAEKVGTPERLKMLCLLTYADIKSVNPEALTPWKAEMLWRLYASTDNYLTRSLDEERVHAARGQVAQAERVLQILGSGARREALTAFLEGFPTRYLRTHSAEEIATHFQMARRLAEEQVQVSLRNHGHFFELTVLMHDRPFLFALLTGTLAAWGMNIIKADAFANSAATVLDTFRFIDLHRTLELNPSETKRFEQSIVDVLTGRASLQQLMSGRVKGGKMARGKVEIPAQARFEDPPSSSSGAARSSLLELIAQDRPGLLYQISSTLSELGANIEVALVDTEGEKVIDVFYLTSQGAPLDSDEREKIRQALLRQLSRDFEE